MSPSRRNTPSRPSVGRDVPIAPQPTENEIPLCNGFGAVRTPRPTAQRTTRDTLQFLFTPIARVRTKSVRNVVERIAREGACLQGEMKIQFGLYGTYGGRARCPHRAETVRKRIFVVWWLRRGEDTAPYRATYHARHLTIFVHTHCKGANQKCEERS